MIQPRGYATNCLILPLYLHTFVNLIIFPSPDFFVLLQDQPEFKDYFIITSKYRITNNIYS